MSQTMMQVEVPPGMQPGQQMIVQAPNGTKVMVVLPPGLGPGQKFQVAIPAGGGPPGGPPPPAPPKSSILQAKEDGARKAAVAVERAKTGAEERLRREEADIQKREGAEKRRAGEDERRKQEMRDEAGAFKREMEALSASTMEAVPTVDVSSVAPPPDIARQPSPIAAVPGALSRLAGAQLATIRPVLDIIKDLMTFSKISRELADFAEKPLNKNKLSKTQAMAILDSIDNQLRWPQALEVLMPALDAPTKTWATEVITKTRDFDSFPKSW